ncbi:MAG: hypothetical protein ACREF7_03990 [Candidatus Saccharimonadales bacterium]
MGQVDNQSERFMQVHPIERHRPFNIARSNLRITRGTVETRYRNARLLVVSSFIGGVGLLGGTIEAYDFKNDINAGRVLAASAVAAMALSFVGLSRMEHQQKHLDEFTLQAEVIDRNEAIADFRFPDDPEWEF